MSKDNKEITTNQQFNVVTYTIYDNDDMEYCHWSKGLNMIITKNNTTLRLSSEEIQQIVKSLPRTLGGSY